MYFSYFVVLAILCIVCYLVFHNKQKVRILLMENLGVPFVKCANHLCQILALILEGRRQRGNGRRRSRTGSAQYRKLDNHLEESGGIDGNGADNAVSVRNIIY